MKKIKLTQGQYALVDDADYADIVQYKWRAQKSNKDKTYYAVRWERGWRRKSGTPRKLIQLANQIIKPPKGKEVDHINRNGLDNRRLNLRVVTRKENNSNRRKYERGLSYKRGSFWWDKKRGLYYTQLTLKGIRKYLGRYKTEVEAQKAINKELRKNGYAVSV